MCMIILGRVIDKCRISDLHHHLGKQAQRKTRDCTGLRGASFPLDQRLLVTVLRNGHDEVISNPERPWNLEGGFINQHGLLSCSLKIVSWGHLWLFSGILWQILKTGFLIHAPDTAKLGVLGSTELRAPGKKQVTSQQLCHFGENQKDPTFQHSLTLKLPVHRRLCRLWMQDLLGLTFGLLI